VCCCSFCWDSVPVVERALALSSRVFLSRIAHPRAWQLRRPQPRRSSRRILVKRPYCASNTGAARIARWTPPTRRTNGRPSSEFRSRREKCDSAASRPQMPIVSGLPSRAATRGTVPPAEACASQQMTGSARRVGGVSSGTGVRPLTVGVSTAQRALAASLLRAARRAFALNARGRCLELTTSTSRPANISFQTLTGGPRTFGLARSPSWSLVPLSSPIRSPRFGLASPGAPRIVEPLKAVGSRACASPRRESAFSDRPKPAPNPSAESSTRKARRRPRTKRRKSRRLAALSLVHSRPQAAALTSGR